MWGIHHTFTADKIYWKKIILRKDKYWHNQLGKRFW